MKQQPKITYNKNGTLEFETSIGTKLMLIKSIYANIITFAKNPSMGRFSCKLTLDDEDIKVLVDWLKEQGMYK